MPWKQGELIGCGAFGEVYSAIDTTTGERCAMKVVKGIQSTTTNVSTLWQSEISTLSKLSHPNVIKYIGCTVDEETQVARLVMEWAPGGSLQSVIRTFGPMSEILIQKHVRDMLNGLAYLHHNNIIHRDVKPANFLLSSTGNILVADFGCAKLINDSVGSSTQSVVGTPLYMAPESITGKVSGKGDVWGLGCTVLEMVNGSPPFSNKDFDNHFQIMFHVAQGNRPEILNPVSQHLKSFLDRCFERDAQKRANCEELQTHPFVTELISPSSVLEPERQMSTDSLVSDSTFVPIGMEDVRPYRWVKTSVPGCPALAFHTATLVQGTLYIIGGITDARTYALSKEVFLWKHRSREIVKTSIESPAVFPLRHSHAALRLPRGMDIFVFGGQGVGHFSLLNDSWILNTQTLVWNAKECTGWTPSPRKGHAMALTGDARSVFLHGGDSAQGASKEMFCLDVETFVWKAISNDVIHGTLPCKRSLHSMSGNGCYIYVAGGFHQRTACKDLHRYDTSTSTWERISAGFSKYGGDSVTVCSSSMFGVLTVVVNDIVFHVTTSRDSELTRLPVVRPSFSVSLLGSTTFMWEDGTVTTLGGLNAKGAVQSSVVELIEDNNVGTLRSASAVPFFESPTHTRMPLDVWVHVAEFLSIPFAMRLGRLNRDFWSMINRDDVWELRCAENGGGNFDWKVHYASSIREKIVSNYRQDQMLQRIVKDSKITPHSFSVEAGGTHRSILYRNRLVQYNKENNGAVRLINLNSCWMENASIPKGISLKLSDDAQKGSKFYMTACCMCSDGNGFAGFGTKDKQVALLDLEEGKITNVLNGHTAAVSRIAMDRSLIISGSFDKTVKLWSRTLGSCVQTFTDQGNVIDDLVYDVGPRSWANTGLILSQAMDRTHIRQTNYCVYSLEDSGGRLLHSTTSTNVYTESLFFDPNTLCFVGMNSVHLYDLRSGVTTTAGTVSGNTLSCCLRVSDTDLIVGSKSGSAFYIDTRVGSVVSKEESTSNFSLLDIVGPTTPNGFCCTAGEDGVLRLWSYQDKRKLKMVRPLLTKRGSFTNLSWEGCRIHALASDVAHIIDMSVVPKQKKAVSLPLKFKLRQT